MNDGLKRVVFFSTSGSENASPSGRWIPLAKHLATFELEIHMLMLHPTYDQLAKNQVAYVEDGVNFRHFGQMHVYGAPGRQVFPDFWRLIWLTLIATFKFVLLARQLRGNYIFLCKPQPANGLAALALRLVWGIPYMLDCDDLEATANRTAEGVKGVLQRNVLSFFENLLPRMATHVTVNTRFLERRLLDLGLNARKVSHMPNRPAIDTPRWPREHDGKTILYVGTLSRHSHGVDLLVDAFGIVSAQIQDARLIMVGDGVDRAELQNRASRLCLSSQVSWIGHVASTNVSHFYSLATCTVDPVYDTDTMRARSPLKIVESLHHGVPVVTGDVGDRKQMVGNFGVIVKPGSAQALADGIINVLMHPPDVIPPSLYSYSDWDNVARKILNGTDNVAMND